MPSDFMEQFRAGFQMGQSRNENARRNQELQMEQARQAQEQERRAAAFQLQQEEFKLRKKQLAAEEHASRLAAAKEAFQMRTEAASMQNLPPPSAADVGVPEQGPEMAGPSPSQINVPQPMQAMPNPVEGQADIQMPVLTGRQQQEMAQALQQRKMREALGMLEAKAGIEAKYRKPDKSLADIEAEAEARARGSRRGAPPVGHGEGGIPDSIVKDIARLPSSWQDWNASHTTRDSFSVRNNEQASAIALANASGKILPTKKQGEQMIAAKATLSDITQAQQLLADPEVKNYVGAYAGKWTDFLAKGWADPFGGEKRVPAKVRKFRAALNRLSAEERHRIYGSALTDTESAFAEGFIPGITQSGATIEASLGEFANDLDRSMSALWGGESAPARPPNVPPEAKWDPATRRWRL